MAFRNPIEIAPALSDEDLALIKEQSTPAPQQTTWERLLPILLRVDCDARPASMIPFVTTETKFGPIDEQAKVDELTGDDIARISLAVEVMNEFEIEVPDGHELTWETAGDLVNYIDRTLAGEPQSQIVRFPGPKPAGWTPSPEEIGAAEVCERAKQDELVLAAAKARDSLVVDDGSVDINDI